VNILLTGSSGFIGSHILTRLLQLNHKITATVRDPAIHQSRLPHVKFIAMDFMQATKVEDWQPLLKDIDVVINAVGIISETRKQTFAALHTDAPSALFSAAEKMGVKRTLQISALGADEQAQSQYHLSKLAADDVLASLDLDWFILRPSLVYGRGAKSMGLFRAMAVLPVIPLIEGGTQEMQPVHVDDLVSVVVRCLDNDVPAKVTLDIVGPEEITMKELLLKQRQWLGTKPTKTLSTPLKWVLKMMPFTRWLDEPALTAESLKMLQRGNTADVSAVVTHLGKSPQSMDAVMANNQASQADRWYARLYFLRPLLRLGLAFVWIWTALVSAFFYPQQESYQLLERLGFSGVMLPLGLYGAALMDFGLGIALFLYQPIKHVLWLQMAVILAYTLLISVFLPEYWLHPFGEISKNIPMLLAILILALMEKK
jgi:uncharacterized protein YbjT (DUF2867 family)